MVWKLKMKLNQRAPDWIKHTVIFLQVANHLYNMSPGTVSHIWWGLARGTEAMHVQGVNHSRSPGTDRLPDGAQTSCT